MKVSSAILAFVIAGFGLCARQLAAQKIQPAVITQPWVIHESKHDKTNVPLKEMPQIVPTQAQQPPPVNRFMKSQRNSANLTSDAVVQALTGSSSITPGLNFEGAGAGFPVVALGDPPDTNLSVGSSQVVEMINVELAIFDKSTGNLLYGPIFIPTLWSGFGGPCENTGRGDPVVVFDKAAKRWVVGELAGSDAGGEPTTECVAVSTSEDALGSYYRYAFDLSPNLTDYVKIGVWPDAYYLSNNSYDNSTGVARSPQLCAVDRSRMIVGLSATAQCFFPNGNYRLVLPSDIDGANPPPPGAPNYFMGVDQSPNALDLFKFHVDFNNASNSSLTGPIQIPVQPYTDLTISGIPQPGVPDVLEMWLGNLMYRLAYRNFGDHESLVTNHTVDAGGGIAGVRWYEIRQPGSASPIIYQQGTYNPYAEHRWMGSIAMDAAGDIALGYSISSSTMYPSIAYTGRVPSDPLGTLQGETIMFAGTGSVAFNGGFHRWGDYTSMSIDPVDDCTFWYANEYLTQTGPPPVHTRIGSFKFPTCTNLAITGPASLPDGTVGVPYASTTVTGAGGTGSYTWSATGLPAGLSINPATGTITGTPTTSSGSPFSVTAKVTDSLLATATRLYSLKINAPAAVVGYVQGASATNDNSAVSIARAFGAANTAGNLIVAAVSWGSSSAVTCSDSQGNTYAVATMQTDTMYNQSLAICYAANVKGGANTVTATFSGTPSYRRLLIHEYQGIALVNPVDVVAKNVANGTTTTNGVTSTSAVTTSSGDLIFGAVMDDFQYTSITAGTGFTQRLSVNNKDMATEDLVQAAAGSIAATQTFGFPDRYLAQMVAFKAGGPANQPPTVAAPASATPNPATATTTNLTVLGADDGGEASLIYTWAPTGTPPAPVTFSANGTNAAKNTVATFAKAGNYSFQVMIKDQGNLTAASSVNVTVKQTVASITVAPATATVAAGATQQFTATASDQFNVPLVPQPSFNWTVNGGGTINASGLFTAGNSAGGPFTVTAASGGVSGIANLTVTGPPPVISSLNPTSAVNLFPGSGPGTQTLNLTVNGSAFVNGAVVTFDTINALSTTFISSGQLTATIPPSGYYLWLSGKHSVQVVNPDGGKSNIAYFDALPSITRLSPSSANAGGPNFTLVLNVTGVFLNVVVNFGSTTLQNASFLNGQVTVTVPSSLITQAGIVNVTITSNGETSNSLPFIVNGPPTVASPASASPNPVTATTANLSVLGADDAGEANLTYTWATTGTPPAPVTFSGNSTNADKNVVATFARAGNYSFQVTIRDQGGLTTTSAVNVMVNQTFTSLIVAPATANVVTGGTQQFTATARDQFTMAMVSPPPFTWTAFGGGTITQTGLFTAGSTTGGPFAISVAAGNGVAVAQVYVVPGPVVGYVQGASATNDNSAGSIAQAFAAANTAGNLIVAAVSWGSAGGVTCSDSQGNAYAVATIQTDTLYNQSLAICYAANVKGGANTVTATFGGSPSYRRLLIHEYQGIALVNPVDVVAKNVANGTTTTNGVTSTSAVTTASGDLIFGVVMDDFQYTSITAGTGFAQRLSVNNKDMATQDLLQAASGSVASTQTFGSPDRYLAQMVAFRPR